MVSLVKQPLPVENRTQYVEEGVPLLHLLGGVCETQKSGTLQGDGSSHSLEHCESSRG